MGRLRPGVSVAQAQAALDQPFHQWVAGTATSDSERANLPVLRVREGAGGLDSLRRQYSKPLYVLLTHGRPDPGDRVRQHGQPAAGASRRPQARDSRAT